MTGCMAASGTAARVMIPAAGDVAGCSWTNSDGELHNGELDVLGPLGSLGID